MAKNRKSRNYGDLFESPGELPSAKDVNQQVSKLTDKVAAVESKRGRKPLEVKRVPYTTSITEAQKFKLKFHAMKNGIRPSDMLHKILEDYFSEDED